MTERVLPSKPYRVVAITNVSLSQELKKWHCFNLSRNHPKTSAGGTRMDRFRFFFLVLAPIHLTRSLFQSVADVIVAVAIAFVVVVVATVVSAVAVAVVVFVIVAILCQVESV